MQKLGKEKSGFFDLTSGFKKKSVFLFFDDRVFNLHSNLRLSLNTQKFKVFTSRLASSVVNALATQRDIPGSNHPAGNIFFFFFFQLNNFFFN